MMHDHVGLRYRSSNLRTRLTGFEKRGLRGICQKHPPAS